jgi:hypothetical protein
MSDAVAPPLRPANHRAVELCLAGKLLEEERTERERRENRKVEERESNCGNEIKICPTSLLYYWVDPVRIP